jgi:hypothetical protein
MRAVERAKAKRVAYLGGCEIGESRAFEYLVRSRETHLVFFRSFSALVTVCLVVAVLFLLIVFSLSRFIVEFNFVLFLECRHLDDLSFPGLLLPVLFEFSLPPLPLSILVVVVRIRYFEIRVSITFDVDPPSGTIGIFV